MKVLMLALLLKMVAMEERLGPAASQIQTFKENTRGPIGVMTTNGGSPIEFYDATNTLNERLLFNEYFLDTLTHLARERIPERLVHAKAGGAFGYFMVTHDFTDICKADMFSAVGKKTPVAGRFSPVIVDGGGIDLSRDARGYAMKFYTEEGNFDIVGFSTPMYVYKDPLLFTTFTRAQKRNPATHLTDGNTFWDFLTLQPETFLMYLLVFGDRGIPDGYQHMPGFAIHTYQVVNAHGDINFIRFHFLPDAGIKNLRSEEARKITGIDPDYAIRGLYNAIARGDFPSWTVKVQVLSLEDVQNAGFDVFDVTKALPQYKYPLRPLGKIVLNRNPQNYFVEIEQLAFNPANLVPGILGAPDKVFEARRLAYRDAQYYRLGANFNQIPVNCPIHFNPALVYNRDGRPPHPANNGGDSPNYYPNSFHGAIPYKDPKRTELVEIYQDLPNNFDQATELYVNEMTKEERHRMIENVLYSLGGAVKDLQEKAVKIFTIIHPDLGRRIQQGLSVNRTEYYYDYVK